MIRIFKFLILILPIALMAQPSQMVNPNGYTVFYYENGKPSSEGTLQNGKPNGYWKTYFLNGALKSEGNRINFQLDSIWKFYNEKGILITEFNYKNGKKNGLKKTFDNTDGYLLFSESYENDIKNGNTIEYYKPLSPSEKFGKVKKTIPFINGLEEGDGFEYDMDNLIITITHYKMGYIKKEERINRKDEDGLRQNTWKEFYPSGTVKKEATYLNDLIDGYVKEYSPTGNLLKSAKFINGVAQTITPELEKPEFKTEYYKSGIIKHDGAYKKGKEEGIHKEYDEEGRLKIAKIYLNGVLTDEGILDSLGYRQGTWKTFFQNGNIKSKGFYANNRKVGDWLYYYQNGKLEQIGKYDAKGKAQGVWKWYYPCLNGCTQDFGNLKKTESYKNNLLEGEMIEYSDSGKVITKGNFVDNEKEGFWFLEYSDYREQGNYKTGKREGEWKHYYVNTQKLRFEGSFIDDTPDGKQTFYYPSGFKKQTGNYVGGLKEGEWEYFDEYGFLLLTIRYKNGIEMRFDGVKVPEVVR